MKLFSFLPYEKLFFSLCLASLFFSACSKDEGPNDPPIITPIDDQSLPSAAILNIKLLEKEADHLKFQMDIAVFRDSKNVEDQLDASSFDMDTLLVQGYASTFQNNQTQYINGGTAADYAALMLLDQSGSISQTDPNDYRLDAAHIFCANLGTNNSTALWSFANYSYQQLTDFTTDTALVIEKIEGLRDHEGGSTPLYRSQYDAITFTHDMGVKTNKAVLTFTDGDDTDYGKTSDQVIEHAIDQQVKLYNIGLQDANTRLLLNQSVATGGAFMYAKDAKQLISIFGNLGKLLTNTAIYYQTVWTLRSDESNSLFQGSGAIQHELNIHLPYGGQITVPFSLSYP